MFIHMSFGFTKLHLVLLQTMLMFLSCKLSSCHCIYILQIVILQTVPCLSCKLSSIFFQTVILQIAPCLSCKLSSCKPCLLFLALGRETRSHYSWCGGGLEELSFGQGSFQWPFFCMFPRVLFLTLCVATGCMESFGKCSFCFGP